ncbi:MAG TPA: DoxX family protein [Acidimicrobiia bacterium]|nr:DoxX family protein [Acidimicrobiia bacterium]
MHRLLWLLQVVFGLYFVAIGVMHFVLPDGLPEAMSWMYDLPDTLHVVSGTAEILGGLGLILPGLTHIRPELTWMAAFGLAIVMLGAAVWHIGRGEYVQMALNVVTLAVLVFIGYGRLRLHPLRSS